MDSLFAQLTPKIEADLPRWYGAEAELVGAPTFQTRPWSFFFRYQVQVSKNQIQPILVKLRHLENMSIQEAVVHKKMRAETIEEYDALVKIRQVFANNTDHFSTIRHLAYYEDLNVIVMEEAEIQTLKSHFQSPSMWISGKARQRFITYMEHTGNWLRIFHDEFGERIEGPFFKEAYYLKAKENLETIETSARVHQLAFVRTLLENLYQKYSSETLPYRTTHDNFSSANVFLTPDEKICSFDPHSKPGPLYIDLAKLIVDLETFRTQVLTNGVSVPASALDKFTEALLNGYFNTEPMNRHALNLFRLLLLIEKWAETEEKFNEAAGKSKLLYSLITHQMRAYFLKLLRKQAYDKNYGV